MNITRWFCVVVVAHEWMLYAWGDLLRYKLYLAKLVWFGEIGEGFAVKGLAFAKQRMLKIALS